MKFLIRILAIFIICIVPLCSSDQSSAIASGPVITVNFEFGTALKPKRHANIYVIWIESKSASFIQNLKVCKRLIDGSLTNTALPFWKTNVYPSSSSSEIDAVTSATQKNCDFTVTKALKDTSIRNFSVFFEIDRSFEPNDWFTNQPAVLYSADVNFDDTITTYELKPIGWTPNESTKNAIPNTEMGVLQGEMKYITHHKTNAGFGDPDPRGLTSIVKRITVSHENFITKTNQEDVNRSLNSPVLRVARNCLNILSHKFISKLAISNAHGKIIYISKSTSNKTSVDLTKFSLGNGLYFVTAIIGNHICSYKFLINN